MLMARNKQVAICLLRREQIYVVAVGVFHNGVPLSPERVSRLLVPVAERGKLIVGRVDLFWTRAQESQGHTVPARGLRPGRVDLLH
jgi:hypothetical protein